MMLSLKDREHFSLRYEDLMADVPRYVGELFAFLGLDVSREVEGFLKGAAGDLFQSHGTSIQPRSTRSCARATCSRIKGGWPRQSRSTARRVVESWAMITHRLSMR